MNFDLDDPLAGILSDGSDDSFFDDDIIGKKKSKTQSTPITDKKKSLFNLEHTEEKILTSGNVKDRKNSILDLGDTDVKINKEIDTNNQPKKVSSPAPFKRTLSKEFVQLHGTDQISKNSFKTQEVNIQAKGKSGTNIDKLDDFDKSTKKENTKVLERAKSSQALLDDILGTSTKSTTSGQNINRPTTAAKTQEFDFDDVLGKSETKQYTMKSIPKKETQTAAPKKENPQQKKDRKSDDWLGIFDEKDAKPDNDDDVPSWLLKDVSKTKKIKEKDPQILKLEEEPEAKINTKVIETKEPPTEMKAQIVKPVILPTLQNSNEDITAEGAALYLQQQESQLMVALQLKAQEEKLAALQIRQEESRRVQKEAAHANHAQLDAMMQKHIANRQQMQSIIATHQDRINERIQALLGPIAMDNEGNSNMEDKFDDVNKSYNSPHSREKKQLLQLVQSLQENHDKEIDLMETSYRRQLAFTEVSLHQSEERMKEETDKLVKFYSEKIGWLESHHQSYKELMEENIRSLTEQYTKEIDVLRQQHLENIKALQEHHNTLMENVKNAVKQEQGLMQDSLGFSTNLEKLVVDVGENRLRCETLVKTIQELVDNTQKMSERSQQVKDAQIDEMLQQLRKEKENFEVEKSSNREMTKVLESRLKQMTQFLEEETAALKQKRMEFEFEKATFGKQSEFAKNILRKQDEDMKNQKEDLEKAYQEKLSRLEEEKSKVQKDNITVAKEKISIQSLKQELEKMKAELQLELEEISEERSKLNIEKQQLQMEGQRIMAKSRDLELLAKSAMEKQSHADQKFNDAEHIQRKYEERIKRIQEHVVSLNSREKQIAREKVALSRERLNLHNEKRQVERLQQCSLCRSMQTIPENQKHSDFDHKHFSESFLNVPVDVSRSYAGNDADYAMSAIEQEMAHLLGRNLGLKPVETQREMSAAQSIDLPNNLEQNMGLKDYMDPKLLMLRLDVQRLIGNVEHNKMEDVPEEIPTGHGNN